MKNINVSCLSLFAALVLSLSVNAQSAEKFTGKKGKLTETQLS